MKKKTPQKTIEELERASDDYLATVPEIASLLGLSCNCVYQNKELNLPLLHFGKRICRCNMGDYRRWLKSRRQEVVDNDLD